MGKQLAQWFFFTVCLALAPLAIHAMPAFTAGKAVSAKELIGGGELLLIAVVVLASAAGEIQELPSATARTSLTGFLVVVVLLGSAWFAHVSSVARTVAHGEGTMSFRTVATGSTVTFVLAVLTKLGVMLWPKSAIADSEKGSGS